MDHQDSKIFESNYISRHIRCDTQAVFTGTQPKTHLILAANRMSRLIDPRRPKELTAEQKAEVHSGLELIELRRRKNELYKDIRRTFGFIYKAYGLPAHLEYKDINRQIDRVTKLEERASLKRIQEIYDYEAPIRDIQAQLAGNLELIEHGASITADIKLAFQERYRIAKAFSEPPTNLSERISILDDMLALCSKQEAPKRRCSQRICSSTEAQKQELQSLELKSQQKSITPHLSLLIQPTECLFCLGKEGVRSCQFATRASLTRHVDRIHLKHHPYGKPFDCPHPSCNGIKLVHVMHFKRHAFSVHGVEM
jgi:hypothetical protein